MTPERKKYINNLEFDVKTTRIIDELMSEVERLQAESDAYQDYINGKITLGQLEAALSRVEPIYQQKTGPEWVTGRGNRNGGS